MITVVNLLSKHGNAFGNSYTVLKQKASVKMFILTLTPPTVLSNESALCSLLKMAETYLDIYIWYIQVILWTQMLYLTI